MQNLYFVRHGQTILNANNHVQGGDIDSPLLAKSIEDAKKTGRFLNQMNISRVISSPQLRALHTAKYILEEFEEDIPLEEDVSLKEFGYGKWEGLHIPTIAEENPEIFRHLREEPHLYNPSSFGGETYQSLIKRGIQSVHTHSEKYPEANLLFVGHSILWSATLLSLVGFDLKDIRSQTPLANTSVTKLIKKNGSYQLDMWNFTNHLI